MKDGSPLTPPPSVTTVSHTNSTAVFRVDYFATSATSVHVGTFTCIVTNPIGSDSEAITVSVTGWCMKYASLQSILVHLFLNVYVICMN